MPLYNEPSTVYLVGAGPGSPDLISVRGLRLVRQAEVLVYDRLVHQDLIAEAQPGAERLFVGKRNGVHTCTQDEINALLIAGARAGKTTVRLKGGDPFVFGRGGEEALALAIAGIPFQVVPGISSAVAAPAFAGIPVTHRGLSDGFAVVTGHTCRPDDPEPDWAALARIGTVVVLMGLGRLAAIAEAMVRHGRPANTPVAVVSYGTTDHQQVVTGTLADIAHRAAALPAPATIIVGQVVGLRPLLDWFLPDHTATVSRFHSVPPA